jgi:hypothetical protein
MMAFVSDDRAIVNTVGLRTVSLENRFGDTWSVTVMYKGQTEMFNYRDDEPAARSLFEKLVKATNASCSE